MSKFNKFESVLSSAALSRSAASSKTLVLQNIIEGDRPEYQYVKVDSIEFNPNNDYNQTDTDEAIRELAEDIRRNGQLHNVVLSYRNDGTYRMLSGERRLRAIKLLYAETQDEKYSSVYALIRKGLSDTEEIIILDAANLHTRNSAADEKRYRKATARFVNNLKEKYNISDEEAVRLTKQHASVQGAVIDKNIVLETDLHPSLLSLLDDGFISKNQAYEYARLPQEVQSTIAEGLVAAKDKSVADFKKLNSDLLEPAKNIRVLDDTIEAQKKELEAIKAAKKETKAELEQADAETAGEIKQKLDDLKQQEKAYKENIKNAQQELDENREMLAQQVVDANETNENDPDYVVGAAAFAEISTLIDDMKNFVDDFSSIGVEEKAEYLSPEDKATLNKRLSKLGSEINRLARVFK